MEKRNGLTNATVCQYPGTIAFASSAGSPTSGIGNDKCSCSTGRTCRLSWLRGIRQNSVTKTQVANINTIRAKTFSKACSCNRTQFYVSHVLKKIKRRSEILDRKLRNKHLQITRHLFHQNRRLAFSSRSLRKHLSNLTCASLLQ